MGMGNFVYNNLKKICESLGKHNDALYAVLAIAVFKGVMRPTFTMMDKESDKETKKYAAFREGLTEAIAFASYVLTHRLILPLCVPIAKRTGASPKKIKNGLSLLSVCLTAGIIIPAVCNLTLKPIMNGVKKFNDKRKGRKPAAGSNVLDIKENAVSEKINVSSVYSPKLSENSRSLLDAVRRNSMQNSTMKVGG